MTRRMERESYQPGVRAGSVASRGREPTDSEAAATGQALRGTEGRALAHLSEDQKDLASADGEDVAAGAAVATVEGLAEMGRSATSYPTS